MRLIRPFTSVTAASILVDITKIINQSWNMSINISLTLLSIMLLLDELHDEVVNKFYWVRLFKIHKTNFFFWLLFFILLWSYFRILRYWNFSKSNERLQFVLFLLSYYFFMAPCCKLLFLGFWFWRVSLTRDWKLWDVLGDN